MADKPEVVDTISEATRQLRRRIVRHHVEPEPRSPVKKQSRLGHRPDSIVQWRLETFTPWKLKSW